MSTITPQVLAAISGAIGAYIADEEACQTVAAGMAAPAPGPPLNLWGMSGRSFSFPAPEIMTRSGISPKISSISISWRARKKLKVKM